MDRMRSPKLIGVENLAAVPLRNSTKTPRVRWDRSPCAMVPVWVVVADSRRSGAAHPTACCLAGHLLKWGSTVLVPFYPSAAPASHPGSWILLRLATIETRPWRHATKSPTWSLSCITRTPKPRLSLSSHKTNPNLFVVHRT